MLENHGVVTGGSDLQNAFERFETLEFAAKTLIKASLLRGQVRYLNDEDAARPSTDRDESSRGSQGTDQHARKRSA